MSKDLSPEEEEKWAAKLDARLMIGKPMVVGTGIVIHLSGDEATMTIEHLRALRDIAQERLNG